MRIPNYTGGSSMMMTSSVPAAGGVLETKSKGGGSGSNARADTKRRAKALKELELNLSLLEPDSSAVRDEKASSFAQAYLAKASDRLDPHLFNRLLKTLNDFDASRSDSVAELYRQVSDMLKDTPDLEQEFLVFLLPEQAMEVGRFIDHLCVTSMRHFFRKLEVCFAKQPHQMRKIFEALSRLSEQDDVTLDQVKAAVLPLLKGNAILTDYFLQLLPSERPPSVTCCSGDEFERLVQIENAAEPYLEKESQVEMIKVPDLDDPYGGSRCPCRCHRRGQKHQSPLHCISCGLKFIKGRVFMQRGKALRQAELVFEGVDRHEVLQRIGKKRISTPSNDRNRKRPAESSPSKSGPTAGDDDSGEMISSSKTAKLKQMKTARSKASFDSGDKTTDDDEEVTNTCYGSSCREEYREDELDQPLHQAQGFGADTIDDLIDDNKPAYDAAVTDDVREPLASGADVSSQNVPASSICTVELDSLESCAAANAISSHSFDVLVDTAGSSPADLGSTVQLESSWTRDEDKIILQTFQLDGDSDKTFTKINEALPARSITEIRSRFQVLMQLLNQLAQGDDH